MRWRTQRRSREARSSRRTGNGWRSHLTSPATSRCSPEAFEGPDKKWPVSQSGKYPKWNRNGRELFYRDAKQDDERSCLVRSRWASSFRAAPYSRPAIPYGLGQTTANYDVSPDGKVFVMVKDQSSSSRLNIVLNWFDELRRLAPVGRAMTVNAHRQHGVACSAPACPVDRHSSARSA